MPGNWNQQKAILSAAKHDSVSVQQIDDMVEQILNVITMTPTFKKYQYTNKPNLDGDATLSKSTATEGMILLRNEKSALPLKGGQQVVLFGNSSYDLIAGGTGSGDVQRAYTVSLVDGLRNSGFKLEENIAGSYQSYITAEKAKRPKPSIMTIMNPPPPIKELAIDDAMIKAAAAGSDIGIFSIGRNAGEGKDRVVDDDFNLTEFEKTAIHHLSEAFHAHNKKFIVVINSGGVIETASWRDQADAILMVWQPGMEGGNAIAEVLSGRVNPSGKLPVTFPVAYADVPSAKGFPGKLLDVPNKPAGTMSMDKPMEIVYEDGIYVGYRYYTSFHVKPAYAFGYGLSYTSFKYSGVKISSPEFDSQLMATVTITNSGKVAGKEVVELYLSAPSGNLEKPDMELKAFAKTGLLKPGESETVNFNLLGKDLASFDTGSSSWIAAAGKYEVRIGASSDDIKSRGTFNLPKEIVVEKLQKAMAPQVTISELKRQ
jgi:beta-glucosidase